MDIVDYWIEDDKRRVYSLEIPFSVGRSPENVYVIESSKASRLHALVQARSPGEFWLTDLGSRNGVFLNRQPIQQSVRLKHLDVFQIADIQFIFNAPVSVIPEALARNLDVTAVDHQTVHAWILIADIIGSVRQAQAHGPTVWTGKVGSWIAKCRTCIEENSGQLSKFLGDGFLSFWTAERANFGHVMKAIEALEQLQKESELPFRLVIHYGPIQLVGISRGELSLTGDEVNFSFRLEKVASGLGKTLVVTKPVVDSSAGRLNWPSLGSHEVPSFPGAFELFAPTSLDKTT